MKTILLIIAALGTAAVAEANLPSLAIIPVDDKGNSALLALSSIGAIFVFRKVLKKKQNVA